VEWDRNGMLIVAERDNTIHLYDSRKGQQRSSKLKSIDLQPHVVDGCQASPSGDYYVATTSARGEGMGELRIWSVNDDDAENAFVYPAHTGPIYQFCFSPDSTRLATGGSDTLVGLWDTETMVCTGTISRRTKFIRSVAFSPDSLLLASSTEEDGIDIADAASGEWLGTIPLMTNRPRGTGGADEVCFYPKRPYLLACARGSDFPMGVNPPPVTIAKWNMVQA
jgi:WD40 repeat protein